MFGGFLLVACQANYIRDVQGGTVAPSSSSELTRISSVEKIQGSS
ncbi:lysis protein [Klebsiella pneumoniae]|nr:lysis protein [Klebsiella pneumoniae]